MPARFERDVLEQNGSLWEKSQDLEQAEGQWGKPDDLADDWTLKVVTFVVREGSRPLKYHGVYCKVS